jgi:outer membrane protein OmpA-like peptidoglycan-associated protein
MKLATNLALVGVTVGLLWASSAEAQGVSQSQRIASADILSQISMFNYRDGGKSKLNLRGTPIAANALGEAEVRFEDGNSRISAKVDDLPAPSTLGPYTTYVLWALTPDGRASNQGVLASAGGKGELETSYGASQFALIVTAEPHFAVSAPSTMMTLYNVADDVEGTESRVTTLAERADYSDLKAIPVNEKTSPIELVQARYAVEIAREAGAERYAPQELAAATQRLTAAESAFSGSKKDRKTAADAARETVVAGEDARRAAMIGASEAKAEADRQAAAAAATAAAAAERDAATVAAAEAAARAEATRARNDLRTRLNAVLPTRETDRGLVSEIGGVQFATGTADLSSQARESLASFSGIIASYPDLRITIEGHTDSTGSPETNRELSLRRAIAVRDYLIGQGIAASSIDVEGLGPSRPVADNETAEGRARNRRVEIVLSGGLLAT